MNICYIVLADVNHVQRVVEFLLAQQAFGAFKEKLEGASSELKEVANLNIQVERFAFGFSGSTSHGEVHSVSEIRLHGLHVRCQVAYVQSFTEKINDETAVGESAGWVREEGAAGG